MTVQNKAVIILTAADIIIPEVMHITLWEKFCLTGRIEDYLLYRKETGSDMTMKGSVHYASDVERDCFTRN